MKSAIRAVLSSLVVIAFAMVPTAASAADALFMLVPGIPGSSVASGHAGWIEILAFSAGVTAPASSTNPAPVRQPTPNPCQIAVSKFLDIASPRLWVATATGQILNNVDIQVVQATGASAPPFVVYDILLTNVQLTSVSEGGSAGAGLPSENVALKATTATLTFTPQNADGTTGTPVTTSFSCS